jgi:hypothetical protein
MNGVYGQAMPTPTTSRKAPKHHVPIWKEVLSLLDRSPT